ncbi:MAG: ParB N-terminal domain-containing protein [Pseudomonadota bacterium]
MKPAPIADVAQDSAATAALQEVTDTLARAREDGRMVLELPLAAIDECHLVRDRTRIDGEELAALRNSIATRGQQTPIEVVALGDERYGLISGWRRLTVLKQLAAETPERGFDSIQALLRQPGDSAEAYVSMVEENEVRVGLSYYERARIAARAVEQGVFDTHKAALLSLFRSASRSKRSKIRSFLSIVQELDDDLRFPEEIPERLGLQLAQAIETRGVGSMRRALRAAAADTAEAEKACLQSVLNAHAKLDAPEPAVFAPRDGVTVTRRGARVILAGPSVDDRLYERLLAFLAQDG